MTTTSEGQDRRELLSDPGGHDALIRAARSSTDRAKRCTFLTLAYLARPSRPALDELFRSETVKSPHYLSALAVLDELAAAGIVRDPPTIESIERAVVTQWRSQRHMALGRRLHPTWCRPVAFGAFIAAMPKSASTFLSTALAAALGLPLRSPHSRDDFLGVQFDERALHRAVARPAVVHSHLAAHIRFQTFAALTNLRPVVLVRNIFDCLVSYAEHAQSDLGLRQQAAVLDYDAWLDFAVHSMGYFYVYFFASWTRYARSRPVLATTYDAVTADGPNTLVRILDYLDLKTVLDAEAAIEQTLAQRPGRPGGTVHGVRFNVGISGRGSGLSETQKASVRGLYRFFPDVDFSPIDPDGGKVSGETG